MISCFSFPRGSSDVFYPLGHESIPFCGFFPHTCCRGGCCPCSWNANLSVQSEETAPNQASLCFHLFGFLCAVIYWCFCKSSDHWICSWRNRQRACALRFCKYQRTTEWLELEGTHKDQFITRIYCCWFIACVCSLNNALNGMTSKCIVHS